MLFSNPFAGVTGRLRSNLIHYLFDIGWWGLYAGATMAFLTIYAARIGATPQQIGLFTALPAGLMLLISLPAAGVVRRMTAWRATWIGALTARGMFALYAVLPFFFQAEAQVTAMLVVTTLISLPAALLGIGFGQLFMEAVPGVWRGTLVSTRNALFAVLTFVVTLVCGQILTYLPFPTGYQVVFFIGFAGAAMTSYHLYKVRPLTEADLPPGTSMVIAPAVPPATNPAGNSAGTHRLLPVIDTAGQRYIRVLALLFLFNMINNMVAPLVPGVLVNRLDLSDAWISIGTAVTNMVYFGVSLVVARLVHRAGNRGGTAAGALLLGAQALILALARGPLDFLISALFAGLGAGLINTAMFNYHLENVPQAERETWLSWNLLLGNAALLLGALIGPQTGNLIGIAAGLLLFGAMRVVMGVMIWKYG